MLLWEVSREWRARKTISTAQSWMMMMILIVMMMSINIYYIKFIMELLNLNFLKQPCQGDSISFTDVEFGSYSG